MGLVISGSMGIMLGNAGRALNSKTTLPQGRSFHAFGLEGTSRREGPLEKHSEQKGPART